MSISWPPTGVRQRLVEHQELETAVRSSQPQVQDVVEKALVRYLVVRSTGLIESTRDDVADQHCQAFGLPRIHRRVTQHLRTGQGVAPEQLLSFVGSFDVDWRTGLSIYLDADDARRKNLLGAMAAARKKIAHGDGDQVTARKALDWSANANQLATWLINTYDPR